MSEQPIIVPEEIIDTRVPKLKAALEQSGVQRRWIGRVSLIGFTGGGVLAAVLAVALVDYLLVLPWMLRLVLMLAVGIGAAVGVIRLIRKWNVFGSAVEVARAIESADPRFGCILSTAIEYGRFDPTTFGEYEAELVDALVVQASAQTSAVRPDVKRSLLKPVGLALLASLLIAAFTFSLPDGITAVRRAAAPWTRAAYTEMTVTPGSADIPEGRDVEVVVTFAGRLPEEAAIAYQEEGRAWTTMPLKRMAAGRYVHVFPKIRGIIRYTVVARKVESPTFTIEAFRAPEIKAWSVRLKYPKYTQQPDRTLNLPDVSTVRATRITYRVEIQEEVKHLALDVLGREKLEMMSEPGTWGMVEIEAKESGPVWLEITDTKGRLTRSEIPYRLVVLPDAPPKVAIAKPARNVRVRANEKVAIEVAVEDDFGLASLTLAYKKVGEETGQELPLEPQGAGPGKYTAKYEFDVAKLGFKVGDVIVYHATAADGNVIDGPGRAKSTAYFIEVTPPPRNADERQQEQQQNNENQRQRQQIDLYELEKQMLQMTMMAGESAPKAELEALAEDQTKVYELGAVFRQMLEAEGIKDPKLLGLLEEAREAMKSAAGRLQGGDQPASIRHEEVAVRKLAELMAIIRPEILQKLNQQLRREIVKREAEEEKRQQEQIPEMLRQVNQLAQEQTQLNQERQEPDPQQQELAERQQDQQEEQQDGQQQTPDEQQRQQEIARKARELEEQARRMGMPQPADRLQEAQARMNLNQGRESVAKLMDAAEALRLLQGRGVPDLSAEGYPGEYENMISSYFRKLSKEE